MGILWVFYYYYLEKTPCLLSRKDVPAASNGDITDNGFTSEIKEQPESPFLSLLHLVITLSRRDLMDVITHRERMHICEQ